MTDTESHVRVSAWTTARARSLGVTLLAAALASVSPISVTAQAPQAGPPTRISWTSDRLAVTQGDVVTILIDEFTIASANRDELSANEKDRNVGIGGSVLGTSLRTQNDVASRTRGESSRRERFSAEMSAVVVELLPNGVARIEGTRKLMIDDHEQEVTVRGLVRAQDISSANTVESWRIAQAELLYDSNEVLGSNPSIWSRLFNLIIP